MSRIGDIARLFSYDKYFKLRKKYFKSKGIIADYYLFRISRIEARHSSFFATGRLKRDVFENNFPILPHGLIGIVITGDCIIGNNCTIYQGVNIIKVKGKSPIIGDNVILGANSIILGGVTVGNNAKIGAGCIVSCDIVNNATVVMGKPRIIINRD